MEPINSRVVEAIVSAGYSAHLSSTAFSKELIIGQDTYFLTVYLTSSNKFRGRASCKNNCFETQTHLYNLQTACQTVWTDATRFNALLLAAADEANVVVSPYSPKLNEGAL